jgi:hypothetical protein
MIFLWVIMDNYFYYTFTFTYLHGLLVLWQSTWAGPGERGLLLRDEQREQTIKAAKNDPRHDGQSLAAVSVC